WGGGGARAPRAGGWTAARAPSRPRLRVARAGHAQPPPRSDELHRLGVVARRGVTLAAVDQRRDLVDALLPLAVAELARELRAARPEPAPARRVDRARHVADEDDSLAGALLARIGERERRDPR